MTASPEPLLLRAAAVAPMDGSPILRGDVAVSVVSGRITAVGKFDPVARQVPGDPSVSDLGRAILLPGLINAHTHLELSRGTPGDAPGSFVEWILSLPMRTGRDRPEVAAEVCAAAAIEGAAQCLRFGVTCVGDITANPAVVRPALRDGPLRVISYGEALGLGRARPRFERGLSAAIDASAASATLSIGLSPHAPYTVDLPGYRQCLELAREHRLPLATHLAETTDEAAFLRHQTGPLRELWEHFIPWSDDIATHCDSPVRFAHAIGLLDTPALLAHVNYCDDEELDLLAGGRASVAYCPRTHAYFGHAPHRWRQMLQRGINVVVGTDSCGSSPDLNLVDDLRLLWRRYGHAVESGVLWSRAPRRAAAAVGMGDSIGTLAPGRHGDIVAFPLAADVDPLGAILDDASIRPTAVWLGGRRAC